MSQQIVDKILNQLKTQVLNLLDDILGICPGESDIVFVRIYFENNVSPEKLMNEFIKWVYPWKDKIKERNEDFFENNEHIFGPIPENKLKYFKLKLKDGTFDQEDKKVIWDYFQVFIGLIEQYNKLK